MKTTSLLLASLITFTANAASAASISGQGTWETTLQGRDLDGNMSTFEAYYDTALNITWLADANYGAGSAYDDIGTVHTNTAFDGRMNWNNAMAWASNLTLGGHTEWRLPTVTDMAAFGCDFSLSGTDCGYNVDPASGEMAYMFYVTLGNKAVYSATGVHPQPGYGASNTGPFSGIGPFPDISYGGWWTSTDYGPNTSAAWNFYFNTGDQSGDLKIHSLHAWAVYDGDIGASTVPVPAAAWLLGSGLFSLIGVARR